MTLRVIFISADSIEPYVIFFHSTTRDEKHWPEHEWRNLIEKLTALSVQVRLPWGNEKEKARAERLAVGLSHVVVLPKLSLNELAYQIANAKAVVSVDTGLAHLTAALDKPNITLYGATDPKLIGCYGKNQHYLSAKFNEKKFQLNKYPHNCLLLFHKKCSHLASIFIFYIFLV